MAPCWSHDRLRRKRKSRAQDPPTRAGRCASLLRDLPHHEAGPVHRLDLRINLRSAAGRLRVEGSRRPRPQQALVQRAHAEVWSQRNLGAIDEIYATDYVAHWAGGPDSRGRDTFKQFVADAYRRAPDRSEVIDQIVAEGDLVVTRFTTRGTFVSEPDEPGKRKQITLQEMAVHRIHDGKIAEQWTVEGVMDVRYLDGGPGDRK